ncbi:hypothetical protein JCM6882_002545 [Rhodosporidiobolus microsporus]
MTARSAQVHPSALSPTEWDAWSGALDAVQAEGGGVVDRDDGVRKLWDWVEGRLETKVDPGRVKEILAFFRTLPPTSTPLYTLLAMLRLASHSVDNSRLTRDHLFLQHPEPVLLRPSFPPTVSSVPTSAKLAFNPFRESASSAGSSTPNPWISAGAPAAAKSPLTPVSPASANPFRRGAPQAQSNLPASPPLSVSPLKAPPALTIETGAAAAQALTSPPLPPRPAFPSTVKPSSDSGSKPVAPPLPTRRSSSLQRPSPTKHQQAAQTGAKAERSPAPSPLPDASPIPAFASAPSPRPRPPTPQRKPRSLTSSSHLGLQANAALRPPSSGRASAAAGAADGKTGAPLAGRRSRGNSSASTTASSWTLELAAPSSPSTKKQPSPLPPPLAQTSTPPTSQPPSTSPASRFKGFSAASVELPSPPSAASSTTITPGHTADGAAPLQRSKTVGAHPPPPPKRRLSTQPSPTFPTPTSPFSDHPPSALHSRAPSLPLSSHRRAPSSTIATLGESFVAKARDEVSRRTVGLRSAPSGAYVAEVGGARARTRTEEELERERERREEGVGLIAAADQDEAEAFSERDNGLADDDPFERAVLGRRQTGGSSTSESDLDGAGGGGGGAEGGLGDFEEDDDEEKREERRRRKERRKEVEREARRREEEGQWARLS